MNQNVGIGVGHKRVVLSGLFSSPRTDPALPCRAFTFRAFGTGVSAGRTSQIPQHCGSGQRQTSPTAHPRSKTGTPEKRLAHLTPDFLVALPPPCLTLALTLC